MRRPGLLSSLWTRLGPRTALGLLVPALLLIGGLQGPSRDAAAAVAAPSPGEPAGFGLRGLSSEALRRGPVAHRPAASSPAPGELRRDGAQGWWISGGPGTRAELAQRLAQASGSRLLGAPLPADAEPLLPGELRFPSTEVAWQWLLGTRRSYVLRCAGLACDVWLPGVAQAAAAPAASSPSAAPPAPSLAARATAAAPAVPQADPPGLFPAELVAEPR